MVAVAPYDTGIEQGEQPAAGKGGYGGPVRLVSGRMRRGAVTADERGDGKGGYGGPVRLVSGRTRRGAW